MFDRVVIIGVGLIGGSFALAQCQRGLAGTVVGISRNPDTLVKARELNVIDEGHTAVEADVVADADLIFIATPLGAFPAVFRQLAQCDLSEKCILTDGGSAKRYVIESARAAFGELPANLVPAHPIAGKERHGVTEAEGSLFVDHRFIITPTERTAPPLQEKLATLLKRLDAIVEIMPPDQHDEIFAATSHLPHLLAYLLVDMLNEHPELGNVFKYTAGGFRDFTRIASSDPVMWRDIALYNHAAIVKWLKYYRSELDQMIEAVEAQDADRLYRIFADAKAARDFHIINRGSTT